MIESPGPVIVDIGNLLNINFDFQLRWYGLLIGLGFLISLLIIYLLIKSKTNENQRQNMLDLLFWVFLGGILGARAWFVILRFDYFIQNPSEILAIWHGGQSIQGGFIGGLVAGLIFYYLNNADEKPNEFLNRYEVCDLIALVLPIAQAIGRFGNFFNIEAFGKPTNLPWGIFVPASKRPIEHLGNATFHPVFFYEAFYLLIVAVFLFWLYSKKKDLVFSVLSHNIKINDGTILCSYLILYSFGRIIFEFMRTDSLMIGPFAAAHVISFITIACASFFIIKLQKKKQET
ncbi:MAG: prolipoprotein diacylglyceryl transferase [Candidatus Caenarcaniphilales bacterium]|nr:prolipoprotein diacylglyceryl transferase [Candidatus Caenarcaniphilales bacterium]